MITKQTIYFTMVHHPTRGKIRARELRKCQAAYRRMVIYIAGRFRAKDGWQIHENVHAAERAGRAVAALGAMPLVPHSIGAHMADTESDDFWLTGTLELMRRCDAVLVLPGYQESQGTMGEIAEAQRIGIPVIMPLDGAPGWEDLRSWLKKPKVPQAQKKNVSRVELAIEDACLFDGQVLTVEREHGKSEVALHTVDESGECYIWLKDDSAICKLISALSLLAQGEGPVALMAEIAEKWQTKRLIDARDKADQTFAELGIELGQREGETLLAAARRVRETGTHAEVERLTQLLEAAKQDAEDTRVRTSARIEKLCQQSNAVAKALGDHHGKTDEEAALALVADLQEARDRHDKVAAVAEKLRKQNEVAGQQLGKQNHEALAFAAKRVVQSAEALRQKTEALEVERDELLAKWERTKGELASERAEHKDQYLFLRSLVNAGPDEALDVAIGKAMMRIKELTAERDKLITENAELKNVLEEARLSVVEETDAATTLRGEVAFVRKERDSLRAEVTMLRQELKTQKTEREEDKKELAEIAVERDAQRAEVRKLQALLTLCSGQIAELRDALAAEKKQRQDFVAALCAELGVQGGERTVMVEVEQMKARLQAPRMAEAIGGAMLRTLLMSQLGMAFALSATDVWVKPDQPKGIPLLLNP